MPPVEDALSDLADHPPAPPTPVARIRQRAARRVRRRRVATGAVAVVAVLAAGFGVAQVVTDDPTDEIVADGGTTTQPLTTTTPSTDPATLDPTTSTTLPEESMTLEPADGLVDGSEVRMALDEPATGEAVVAQCSAEVQDVAPGDPNGVLDWCTGITYTRADALAPYTVRRVVETTSGPVDCAEPDRCILAVRIGGPSATDDRHAVLRFRPDLPPVPEPEVVVDGDEGTVGDGDRLLLSFDGVQTGLPIWVAQCIPGATPDEPQCSSARSLSMTVQDGPDTQLSFTAFHDVLVDLVPDAGYDPGWTACEPCELVVSVGEQREPLARLPMAMEPTDTPIRPTVAVDPAGPLPSGSTVTVQGAGLQPGSRVIVGWCPTVRAQGGGSPPCTSPSGVDPSGVLVADDGTLLVTGFEVIEPDAFLQDGDCSIPGDCGIGLDAGDQFSVMAIAPIELTG